MNPIVNTKSPFKHFGKVSFITFDVKFPTHVCHLTSCSFRIMIISPKAKVDAPLSTKKSSNKKKVEGRICACSLIPSTNEVGICKSFGMGIWMK